MAFMTDSYLRKGLLKSFLGQLERDTTKDIALLYYYSDTARHEGFVAPYRPPIHIWLSTKLERQSS